MHLEGTLQQATALQSDAHFAGIGEGHGLVLLLAGGIVGAFGLKGGGDTNRTVWVVVFPAFR